MGVIIEFFARTRWGEVSTEQTRTGRASDGNGAGASEDAPTQTLPAIGRGLLRPSVVHGSRLLRRGIISGVVAILVLGGLLAIMRATRDGVLPRMILGGKPVGSLTKPELRAAARRLAVQRGDQRVQVIRAETRGEPEATSTFTLAELGFELDVEATVERVFARGRQRNLLASLSDHIRATFGVIRVEPVRRLSSRTLDRWVETAVAGLALDAHEGDLLFEGGTVDPVYPSAGLRISARDLAARARPLVMQGTGGRLVVTPEPFVPVTTRADVDQALSVARAILSAPVRLFRADASLVLPPARLAPLLAVEVAKTAPRLRVQIVPAKLDELLKADTSGVRLAAVDATFRVEGDVVTVVPGRDGFDVDVKQAVARIREIATMIPGGAPREFEAPGTPVPPKFTTEQAQALNITGKVSTFTTNHRCCETRVKNIHRIADIVNGSVVKPGEVFSLNRKVGMRTPENGFLPAPAIRDGELVDETGGGVSQFATTLFNAVFFGGYDFLEYQPHSYYFTRYPRGREATVSWPSPDLRFKNDSAAGIFIQTSYTNTSITVTFFGTTDVAVEVVMGEPANITEPPTQCKDNPALAPGTQRQVQKGSQGFDVVVDRILVRPDGRRDVEHFTTHYKPEPFINEANPCPPSPP